MGKMRKFLNAPNIALLSVLALSSIAVAQDQKEIGAPVGDVQPPHKPVEPGAVPPAQQGQAVQPVSQAGQPIPRQAPEDQGETAQPAQSGDLPPGTSLDPNQTSTPVIQSSNKPNLPARPLTKEELDKVRRGMVDTTTGMILQPGEVGQIRDATLGSQSAAVRPTYSTDPYPRAAPRVVQAAKTPLQQPPVVRLAYGMQTPVTFVDSDGYPWPVSMVTYNPLMLAQDGAGCGNASTAPQSVDGSRPTTINLTPCYFEIFGNINVNLDKFPYPVVLVAQSGFRPQGGSKAPVTVDLPLTVVVEGRSPLAEKVKPVSLRPVRTAARGGKRPGRVVTGDDDLAPYIVGRAPRGSSPLGLEGAPDTRAYRAPNGDLIVVGPADVLTPHFTARAQTPDGEKAFRFRGVPPRILLGYRSGEERPATVMY